MERKANRKIIITWVALVDLSIHTRVENNSWGTRKWQNWILVKYHFKSNVIGTAARRRKVELEWQFFTMNYISLLTFSYCLISCFFFVVWLGYSAIIWRQQALQTLNRKKFKDGLFPFYHKTPSISHFIQH